MDFKGMPVRAIIALISCVLLVVLFNKLVAAFIPGTFTPAQTSLIDWLIFVAGFIYVLFGKWPPSVV